MDSLAKKIAFNLRNDMTYESQFSINRAGSTISAARQVAAKWIWVEKTPNQMQTQLETITGNKSVSPPVIGQMEIASQAQSVYDSAHGTWHTQLNVLHQLTVQGLNMAKTKLRNDPAGFAVVAGLHASGHSPDKILAEALAWESAWGQVAPTWSPTTSNTLAAFKTLRKQCADDLQTAFKDADSANREQSGKLAQMCLDLEDVNVAWYADATRVFAAGTPEGDMIRSTVPTTYTPSTSTPPPAPAPAATPAKTP
jgi:hypothetical protein